MTTQEALSIVASLKAAYPRQEVDRDTLDIYAKHLTRLDFDLAVLACEQHIAESPFFPAVAEIRSRAKAIDRGQKQPEPEKPAGERLTPAELAKLREWSKTIGGRMDDLPDPEPMPAEDWFAEHGDEALRLIAPPAPRDRDSA